MPHKPDIVSPRLTDVNVLTSKMPKQPIENFNALMIASVSLCGASDHIFLIWACGHECSVYLRLKLRTTAAAAAPFVGPPV